MKKPYDRPIVFVGCEGPGRVTLSDSFRIRPRTEVSSLLIVQPAAKIQCPEPRVERQQHIEFSCAENVKMEIGC